MSTATSLPDVHSAGAVVARSGKQVLLVHRPRYDDWSFPKGNWIRANTLRLPASGKLPRRPGSTYGWVRRCAPSATRPATG